jgi:effector-binding domain-containing protein
MEPRIVTQEARPYVGVRGVVTMDSIPEIADRFPEVFGWLNERGVLPAGAPFLKYNLIDMQRQLEIEAGVPVEEGVSGDDRVFAGVLPAGRYATVTHVGHPAALVDVTAALLEWAAKEGLAWDMRETPEGQRWECRLESYLSEPDVPMENWETELAFRLA